MITALLSQFWVQKLGWTLLHFLWQGTAIAIAYAILRSVLSPLLSTQGRYILACLALAAMVLAPPLSFLLIENAPGTSPWTISEAEWQKLLPVIVALWLMGVAAFSIRFLGGWRFTARLRSISHPVPAEWRRTLERIAARVGATQPIELLVSSLVNVPTVIGWLRPVILVPVEFFTGLSFEHITALLAHEMAHIRRHDYLANILQGIAEAILFYHPAVWWVSEQIRAERELCCDDLAVAATGDVLAYARALVELESLQPARLSPALAANGGSLVNRIRRLIEPARGNANNFPGPAAAWAMTLLWLAGVGMAAAHGPQLADEPAVKRVGVPNPPSPLIAFAEKARNTVLYDPLLAEQPAQLRIHAVTGTETDRKLGSLLRHSPNEDGAHTTASNGRPFFVPSPFFVSSPSFIPSTTGDERRQIAQQAPEIKLDAPELNLSTKLPDSMLPMYTATVSLVPTGAFLSEPPTAPTFRTATKLVQVDVIARSKSGPAGGLTSEDFTLLDNGSPQNIASFSVTSSQIAAPVSAPLPAGVVSNRLERGGDALPNATVLLIDQRNTAQADQAYAIQRVATFLKVRRGKDTKPSRIGIYAFDRDSSLRAVQEITNDLDQLSRAAATLKPQDPSYRAGDTGRMTHSHDDAARLDTKHMLAAIARHLASVPGRKGLIWITAGPVASFDYNPDMEEAASALNDANIALYAVDARGLVGALSGTTAIANAESGVVEAAGVLPRPQLARMTQPSGGFSAGAGSLSKLADLTGGLALYNSNAIEDSIQKALDDAELTYTLGFYPTQQQPDGVWHKLQVVVDRPGVRVRYREKYFASHTLAEAIDRPTLTELLSGPLDATQLELVTETMPDQARPGSWQVHASVDLHDVHLENRNNTWVGAVDVSFLIEGSQTARTVTRTIEIPDRQLTAALETGIAVNQSIAVNAPAGEIRIVAQDRTTGAAGSVRIPLRDQ